MHKNLMWIPLTILLVVLAISQAEHVEIRGDSSGLWCCDGGFEAYGDHQEFISLFNSCNEGYYLAAFRFKISDIPGEVENATIEYRENDWRIPETALCCSRHYCDPKNEVPNPYVKISVVPPGENWKDPTSTDIGNYLKSHVSIDVKNYLSESRAANDTFFWITVERAVDWTGDFFIRSPILNVTYSIPVTTTEPLPTSTEQPAETATGSPASTTNPESTERPSETVIDSPTSTIVNRVVSGAANFGSSTYVHLLLTFVLLFMVAKFF